MKITTNTIAYSTLWVIIAWLVGYTLFTAPKVRAGEELIALQQQIAEQDRLIATYQEQYKIADESKLECMQSWDIKMQEANRNADNARAEKDKLEKQMGLIVSRTAQ